MSNLKAGMPDTIIDLQMDQATLIANSGFALVSPVDGYISELRTVIQAAVTTGGTITVFINGTAVAGLSVAVANGAAKGVRAVGVPTAKSASRKIAKGDYLEVRTASFATAGAINAMLTIAAADTDGVMPY